MQIKTSRLLFVAILAGLLLASAASAGPRFQTGTLGSIGIEVDPVTGHGSVTFGKALRGDGPGQQDIVNNFFDLTGLSCVDCGQGLCEAGQTRNIIATFEQNGGAAGILDFGLANVSVIDGANDPPVAINVSCAPGATCSPAVPVGATVTVDITVELNACAHFGVFFDLDGLELLPPANNSCPCYDTNSLAAVNFQEPLACVNAVNGPFPFFGEATAPIPSVPPFAVVVTFVGCTNLDAIGTFQQPLNGQQFSDCACSVLYDASSRGVACGPLPAGVDCSNGAEAPLSRFGKPARGWDGDIPDSFLF